MDFMSDALYGVTMVFAVTAIALATGQLVVASASVAVALVVMATMLSKLGYFQPRRLLFRTAVSFLSGLERFRHFTVTHDHPVALAEKKHT